MILEVTTNALDSEATQRTWLFVRRCSLCGLLLAPEAEVIVNLWPVITSRELI